VLALETVPDIDEAEALRAAIAGLGTPSWLSYSIAGELTCAGPASVTMPCTRTDGDSCCRSRPIATWAMVNASAALRPSCG
jgi:S-methylmethionine-dependent homocysteine/selenocysteine methylase